MKWLFFIILPLLAATKATIQGYFSKSKVKSLADTIKFNGFMFLYSSLALIIFTVRQVPTTQTIIYALIVSVLAIAFQSFYVCSFREGAVSLSTTIVNFACAIPVLFSIIFTNASVTIFKIIGFILVAVAIIILPSNNKNPNNKNGIKTTKRWLFLIITATLCSGAINIMQNVFATSAVAYQKAEFNALYFGFASVLCFLMLPILKSKSQTPLYKNDLKINLGLIVIGVVLGLYNLLVVYALEIIPATEYFPTISGLQILTAVIIASITFKEIPSVKQLIGICLTIVAVVFINLQ